MNPVTNQLPRSICARVTRRCNAACSFCQAPNNSRLELSVDELRRIAGGLAALGVRTMKLSGGEPTMRRDLPAIIRAVRAGSLKPVIITNGIRLDNAVVSAAVDSEAEFKFSVHRPTAANDDVVKVRSFSRILTNLVRLRRRNVQFSINTVVSPQTTDLIPAMILFARDVGARKISFIPIVPRGRAAARAEYEFEVGQLDVLRDHIQVLATEYDRRPVVRCIDIRRHDYWIVENDGSLWIERASEDLDVEICDKDQLLRITESAMGSNMSQAFAAGLDRDMLRCIELARDAAAKGNYALGALVVRAGVVLSESGSSLLGDDDDPTAHPEMVAIRAAAKAVGSRYLPGAVLVTTLEPCPMCTAAAIWAKMDGIAFGATRQDADLWSQQHPHDLYTWRQIRMSAREVIDAGTPRLELHEGLRRAECRALFDLTSR